MTLILGVFWGFYWVKTRKDKNIQHSDLADIKHNHNIDQPFLGPKVFQYKISFTQMCVLEWILSTEEKTRNAQAVTGSKGRSHN